MDILIRNVDLTATGREIVRDKRETVDQVTIGRASSNTIHLPDLAVEQNHIVMTPDSSGALYVEAVGTLGFTLNGVQTKAGSVDPASDGEIELGSYRIVVSTGEDGSDLTFTVRSKGDDSGGAKDQLAGFGVASVLPSRRITAWVASLAIILAFLAVPVITHLVRDRGVQPDIDSEGAVLMDASWSTGDLSMAHHGLEDNCEACHVNAFEAVRDETCLSCHTEIDRITNHADIDDQRAAMPPLSRGDALLWDVAHAFGKPGPVACTDCHTEHEAAGELEPFGQQFCADCHVDIESRLDGAGVGNARDFAALHPEFAAIVSPVRGAPAERQVYDEATTDFNGLKFTHDQHLSTTNGVARMAMRLGISGASGGMECATCHTNDDSGFRYFGYLPVNMDASCESCHSLVFERRGNQFRSLTHGDIAAMQAELASGDRTPRRPVSTGRRRPGPFAVGGIYYGNFSRVMGGMLTRGDLAEGGLCGECHYADTGGDLAVEPVVQRGRYLSTGWFNHDAHGMDVMRTDSEQAACASCHGSSDAGRPANMLGSDSADDLLLPTLASCRDCHYGAEGIEPARLSDMQAHLSPIQSDCAMCHSYHAPAGQDAPPRHAALLRVGREREQ